MLQITNLGFGTYHHEGEKMNHTRWPFHDLIILLQGSIFLRGGSQDFHLEKNDAVLMPPHCAFHGHTESRRAVIWVLHFRNYRCEMAPRFLLKKKPFVIPQLVANPFYRQCIDRMQEADEANPERSKNGVLKSLAMLLLAHAEDIHCKFPTSPATHKPFDEIIAWARENLPDGMQVRNMAEKAGLSESHFRKCFRKHYAQSPAEQLQYLRIEEAKRLLQQTQYPLKEISRLTGYADVVSFHRAFQNTGMTPAKYRASLPKVI